MVYLHHDCPDLIIPEVNSTMGRVLLLYKSLAKGIARDLNFVLERRFESK
ncbi:hypothetical protein [Desulfolucanica intricata]|nr:hypothetical protein [Desulfolucanica intricata]